MKAGNRMLIIKLSCGIELLHRVLENKPIDDRQ